MCANLTRHSISTRFATSFLALSAPSFDRVLLADCTIRFESKVWFIPAYYRPNDRVTCLPTPSGDALLIQDPDRAKPDIWAEPVGPAHSPQHSDLTPRNDARWGTLTTSVSTSEDQAAHPSRIQPRQPLPMAADNTRPHKPGNSPEAPAVIGNAIGSEPPIQQCMCPCNGCIHRPPSS